MIDYKSKTLNELLSYEVAQIDDPNIQKFVKETLNVVNPCHAWKPASSTGKYHPQFALGEGGLIRHIKVVVRNAIEMMRAVPQLEEYEHDEFLAAAILHDMWKYPEGRDNEFTAFDHPKLGGDYCKQHGYETIGRLIASHQGIWTTNERLMPNFANAAPDKFDEWCLHFCDFYASREYLNVEFDEDGELITTKKRRVIKD